MAVSIPRRKSKSSRKAETRELCFCDLFLFKCLTRIPAAIFLLILVFLWSSSTTIISGKLVHVCISSRKLNNLYCLSAGSQPNFEIPIPVVNNGSSGPLINVDTQNIDVSSRTTGVGDNIKEIVKDVVNPDTDGKIEESIVNAVSLRTTSVGDNTKESVKEVSHETDGPIKESFVNGVSSGDGSIEEIEYAAGRGSGLTVMDMISEDSDEIAVAKKAVEEQLQMHRSWISNTKHDNCDGRGVYVYDLPSKFNKDLVGQCGGMIPWEDICVHFKNDGLGVPIDKLGKGWFHTHQYSLEPIFHGRILKHPCRVYNENEAKLFYVPYYGGLDILRWHFKNVSNDVKDTLSLDLLKWLSSKKSWVQNSGKDHVFVLGKISWDFRRRIDSSWGTQFLVLEQMQNPIKLMIERQPWEVNDIGIPHPTFFHPHSDDDIISWQLKIIRAPRKNLVSFAGAPRPDHPENIRSALINQCTSRSDKCKLLNCKSGECDQPESVIELFMDSEFCLQPPGDSPTRKSVFDSLVSGCIPVLFDPFTAYYQYPWHFPEDHDQYSVFINQEEVRKMKVNVVEKLMNVSTRARQDMRRYIVFELLPGLVYGDSNSQLDKFQDAFSITVNNLLERVNKLQ